MNTRLHKCSCMWHASRAMVLLSQDAVKADAGHVLVEEYIASLSFPSCASFRPQYMIGSGNNKDCEEWFFDRKFRLLTRCFNLIFFSIAVKSMHFLSHPLTRKNFCNAKVNDGTRA